MMDMYYDGKASNFIRKSLNVQSQGLPLPLMKQGSNTFILRLSTELACSLRNDFSFRRYISSVNSSEQCHI